MSATPAAPVASKSVEDCMRLADERCGRVEAKLSDNDERAALQAAIVAYGDAQWTAAIEAAANTITPSFVKVREAILALKREPR